MVVFLQILLSFAVAASAYVLHAGLQQEGRSMYKLVLHCVMIIISVVPPELPMELSVAVNSSLAALMKLGIFCTEPFRIPYAGKVDACCFDKTGTITSDDLVVHGVVPASALSDPAAISGPFDDTLLHDAAPAEDAVPGARVIVAAVSAPKDVVSVLAACHGVAKVDGVLVGDPLEVAVLKSLGWTTTTAGLCMPESGERAAKGAGNMTILRRWPFSSSLRRMTVAVSVNSVAQSAPQSERCRFVTKGAPEVRATPLVFTTSCLGVTTVPSHV